MESKILGIHHVTAIAGDPQANLDFYTGVLGLRLIKLTVNFDDPGTYHLYYGDGVGSPGTILTFFPWPGAPRGRLGSGQVGAISLSTPKAALGYWAERLTKHGVAYEQAPQQFGEESLSFHDPDGLQLQLVASRASDPRTGWVHGPVPSDAAIRGVHTVTLWEQSAEPTARLLSGAMGFRPAGEEGGLRRFAVGDGNSGALVDVQSVPGRGLGTIMAGSVHHVAFRTPDDEQQLAWRDRLAGAKVQVTPVQDRKYFHSIYFREPGHVLFEIATDPPGFAVDEPAERLGSVLQLPPWLEPKRADLEGILPPLRMPETVR